MKLGGCSDLFRVPKISLRTRLQWFFPIHMAHSQHRFADCQIEKAGEQIKSWPMIPNRKRVCLSLPRVRCLGLRSPNMSWFPPKGEWASVASRVTYCSDAWLAKPFIEYYPSWLFLHRGSFFLGLWRPRGGKRGQEARLAAVGTLMWQRKCITSLVVGRSTRKNND